MSTWTLRKGYVTGYGQVHKTTCSEYSSQRSKVLGSGPNEGKAQNHKLAQVLGPKSSFFLWLIFRILEGTPKQELLWSLWV